MKKYLAALTLAAIVAITAQAASVMESSTSTPPMDVPPNNIQTADKVLISMHHMNLVEIEMGKLAKEKGASNAMREYGKSLMDDHQQSEKLVMELAEELGTEFAEKEATLTKPEHDKMTKLKNKKGSSFDREFASTMVETHKKVIGELEAARNELSGSIAELIDLTLPFLKDHQQTAEQLLSALQAAPKAG